MTTPESILRIEAYSLYEFCQKIQEAIQQGYEFDFESNERFPISYGSFMTAGMVLKYVGEEPSKVAEEPTITVEVVKPEQTTKGRPKKVGV